MDDPFVGPAVRVSIFLSPLDVHVNRAPIAGLVVGVEYAPGRFLAAYRPRPRAERALRRSRLEGEQRAGGGASDRGGAGAADRLPGAARATSSAPGERFGMIRFGSRTDLVVPRGAAVRVRVGGPGAGRRDGDGSARDETAARRAKRRRGARRVAGAARAPAAASSCCRACSRPATCSVASRACVLTLDGRLPGAALALFVAMVMDILDGKVARLTKTTTQFGVEFDSLADVVSFCVAPAFLLYSCALPAAGAVGLARRFLFVICGALRLARFNVLTGVTDRRYFIGLPIPGGGRGRWRPPSCSSASRSSGAGQLFALAVRAPYLVAFLMVSTFRYYCFKEIDFARRHPFGVLLVVVAGASLIVSTHPAAVPLPALLRPTRCRGPSRLLRAGRAACGTPARGPIEHGEPGEHPVRVRRTAMDRVIIFDTTLRDGEQAPGFSMNTWRSWRWRASSPG